MANSILSMGAGLSGSQTVTTAGTRVQLQTTKNLFKSIVIVAKDNNTGRIYVGGSDVASTTNLGLAPGDSVTFSTHLPVDLSDIYIDASVSAEGVDFYCVR